MVSRLGSFGFTAPAFVAALALAGCGASFPRIAPVEPVATTMTLGVPDEVGMKTHRTTHFHFDLDVEAEAGSASVHKQLVGDGSSERTEEILAATGDRIEKVSLSYIQDSVTIDGDVTKTDACVGRTYIATAPTTEGLVTVTMGSGAEPSAKETERVRHDFETMQKAWQRRRRPSGPVTLHAGDAVGPDAFLPALEREAAKMGVTVSKASAVYRGRHDDEGVFDIDLRLSKDDSFGGGAMNVDLDLRGQAALRISDARAGEYTGAGKMTARAHKNGAEVSLSGSFTGTGAWSSVQGVIHDAAAAPSAVAPAGAKVMSFLAEKHQVTLLADGAVMIDAKRRLTLAGSELQDEGGHLFMALAEDGTFTGPMIKQSSRIAPDGRLMANDGSLSMTVDDDGTTRQYLNGKVIDTFKVEGATPATRRTAILLVSSAFVVLMLDESGKGPPAR